MAYFDWDSSYSVGVEEIDTQHKKLINLLNTLVVAMNAGKGKEVLGPLLNDLVDYTKYHFGKEQEYFEKFNYPGAEAHIHEHREFINKVDDFKTKFEAKKMLVSVEILNFLRNWVDHHIKEIDKKYTAFFHENGLK